MEDDVVLHMLQVGFRPSGMLAGSGGPRGRSDTGMAAVCTGRPGVVVALGTPAAAAAAPDSVP